MLPTKFRFIWPSGFRGEDSNQGSILSSKMVAWATKFVFADQNFNLVASMTTTLIEVGNPKEIW
jgi:hypothetical protein